MNWQTATTADRIAAIKGARAGGAISMSEIAASIGGISRCAVAGFFNRYPERLTDVPLQKASPATRPRQRSNKPPKTRNNVGRAIVNRRFIDEAFESAPKPTPSTYDRTLARHVRLDELERGECKWPVNNPPKGSPHLFCGQPQAEGSPYCAHHTDRAFRPGER